MKNIKVTLYKSAVKKLTDDQLVAAKKTANQMRTEIINSSVIPFDEGTLQNIQTQIDDKELKKGLIKITHDTAYALRLYFHPEYNFSKLHNMNARGEWWEDWLTGSLKSRPAKIFRTFYKNLMK